MLTKIEIENTILNILSKLVSQLCLNRNHTVDFALFSLCRFWFLYFLYLKFPYFKSIKSHLMTCIGKNKHVAHEDVMQLYHYNKFILKHKYSILKLTISIDSLVSLIENGMNNYNRNNRYCCAVSQVEHEHFYLVMVYL